MNKQQLEFLNLYRAKVLPEDYIEICEGIKCNMFNSVDELAIHLKECYKVTLDQP